MKYFTFSELGRHGALGNQLWQIAGTIGEADKRRGICFFPHWAYRGCFQISPFYFSDSPESYRKYRQELDGTEVDLHDFYPDYMQNIYHFDHMEDDILRMFMPSPWIGKQVPRVGPEATAVHVRRANNLQLPNHHPVPPLEYFEAALKEVPTDNLWVFSDDLEWCRKQKIFEGANFGIGPPTNINIMDLTSPTPLSTIEAALDLHTMARCNYHVISNSSFSWWGAYLADGDKVIYPSNWYGPALDYIETSVMFPKNWTKI